MIFAAGFGSRLQPITNHLPKALVPVADKTLLEHTILTLKGAGIDEIIVNLHHFGEQIIDFLKENNNFGIRIEISDERDKLLDTGGGMKHAKDFFDDGEPFLIHNVDIFSNIDLKKLYAKHLEHDNRLATLVVSERETNRYLLFDADDKLSGWVNTATGETRPTSDLVVDQYRKLAFSGIQVVSPRIFELMESEPDKFPIIDFYLRHCESELIAAYVPENLKMIDVGKLDALDLAEDFLSNQE